MGRRSSVVGALACVAWLAAPAPSSAGVATPVPLACQGESGASAVLAYSDSDGAGGILEDFGDCISPTVWANESWVEEEGSVTAMLSAAVTSDGFAIEARASVAVVLGGAGDFADASAAAEPWARFAVAADRPLLELAFDTSHSGGGAVTFSLGSTDGATFHTAPLPEGASLYSYEVAPGDYELRLHVAASVAPQFGIPHQPGAASAEVVAAVAAPEPGAAWLQAVGASCLLAAGVARAPARRRRAGVSPCFTK